VAARGYAEATVTDICRAAGVTRPAFYVLLDVLASVPAFAQMAIVEIEAVGPPARRERGDLLERFSRFFDDAPRPAGPAAPEELIEALVGGVYATIYRYVATGRAADLPGLLPTLEYFVFVPFLGIDEAVSEVESVYDDRERTVAPCVANALGDNGRG
jgi:AcrR family transcriptional regulator